MEKLPTIKAGYYDFDPAYLFNAEILTDDLDATGVMISSLEDTTFSVRFDSSLVLAPIHLKIKFEVMTTFDFDGDGTDEGTWPYRDPAVELTFSLANGDWDAGTYNVELGMTRAGYAPGVHEVELSLTTETLDSIIRFDGGIHYGEWVLWEESPSILTAQDFASSLTAFADLRIRGDVVFPPPAGYTGYWGMNVRFMEVQVLRESPAPTFIDGAIDLTRARFY